MRILLLYLLLLGFYLSQGSAFAVDEDTLLSVRDDPYRFSVGEKETKTRILLIPGENAKKAGTIALAVVELGHDGVTLVEPKNTLTIPDSVGPDENGLYFIEPILNTSAIEGKFYGTYVVTFLASARIPAEKEGDPPIEISETFNATISYPKIALETPQELLIEQTCVFGLDCDTVATKLNIEAKGSTGPVDLRIVQASNAQHGDRRIPGTINVQEPSGRDDLQKLAVTISVPFPKGDSTGTLRVSSPEIERLNVNYKVQRRDGLVTLGIIVLIGLAAGLVLRTNLEKGLQRRRREMTLKALLQRIIESRMGIGDKTLQDSLGEIASQVEDRINDHSEISDAALKSKVTDWETELGKALDTSAETAGETENAMEALDDLARANWTAPIAIRDALASSLADIEIIRQQIRDRDYDAAAKQLEGVQTGLHRTLAASIETWRVAVNDSMAALGDSLPEPLPAGKTPDFGPIGTALSTSVGPVEIESGEDPNVSAKTILKAAHVAVNAVNRLLYKLRRDLDATAVGVSRTLGDRLETEAATNLETARERLATMKPESWTAQPDGRQAELTRVMADVTAAMTQAVRSVGEPVSSETADRLGEGKYIEAAKLAIKPTVGGPELAEGLPRAASRSGAPLDADTDIVDVYFGSSHGNWIDTREPALRFAHVTGQRAARIERLKLDRLETASQIAIREILQSGVAWVGLAVVALFIFGDTFVGTYQDYIKVFLWGFTTDVGVGTLLDRAKTKVQ